MSEQHEVLPSEEIRRRIAEKAQLAAELEARFPKKSLAPGTVVEVPNTEIVMAPPTQRRITVDMTVLHDLVVNARVTADRAESLEAEYAQARIEAAKARGELDRYTAEHGLR